MPKPYCGRSVSSSNVSARGTRPEANSSFQKRFDGPAKWCRVSADRTPGLIPTKSTRTPG
ncbi:MAG: hypothetical protein ABI603_15245 [Acidobacteriota bacterium]